MTAACRPPAKVSCVDGIAAWRLCLGCGACAWACPNGAVTLHDVNHDGIRPVVDRARCRSCGECLAVCPGYGVGYADLPEGAATEGRHQWGPVLEVWEGYAADDDLRFRASSGGAATALAVHFLEHEGMAGVLHSGPDSDSPLHNHTVFSTTADGVRAQVGSRYAPASPCEGLGLIENSPGPCAFVGKSCDVHALRKAQNVRPALNDRVGIAISIFCAGTPSTHATRSFLQGKGIEPDDVTAFRYRGHGWPGRASASTGDGEECDLADYEECWGMLQSFRPYRCHLCPDGTGEFADISCGDAWHRTEERNRNPGLSMVVVRTERGRALVRHAIESGALQLKRVEDTVLDRAQPNLMRKRRAVAGRIAAFRTLGLPAPSFPGLALGRQWLKAGVRDKLKSYLGTIRRIVTRKYYSPMSTGA